MGVVSELVEGKRLLNIDGEAQKSWAQEGVNPGTTPLTGLGSNLLMIADGVELHRSSIDESYPGRLNVFHFGADKGSVTRSQPDAPDHASA